MEKFAENYVGKDNKNQLMATASAALLFCYKSVGFFNEATDIISNFNPSGVSEETLVTFYILCASTYQNLSSYVSGTEDLASWYDYLKKKYYMLALEHADKYSYEYAWIGLELELLENYSEELAVNGRRNLIGLFKLDEHEYAVQYSILASALGAAGRTDESLYYRAISTIYDIRSCTHETTSAKAMAEIMYERGSISRAYKYIQQALYDAEFYNSRLRLVEINTILPVIENSRYDWMRNQRMISLLFGSVVLVLLIITMGLLLKLKRLNLKLKEANAIKDEYIISSLYGNTSFINEIEGQTAFAARKIMTKQYGDALEILHKLGIKEERERMFASFDSAFIKLFPNFMDEFNKLFPTEARIHLDENGRLPMEIRIFALMRLGIDNASQVAEYLNLSVNTVYVYKAKIKAKAIVPKEDFDNYIMNITKP